MDGQNSKPKHLKYPPNILIINGYNLFRACEKENEVEGSYRNRG